MTKLRVLLTLFAVICTQHTAGSQTVSGRSFITGFELGDLTEGIARGTGGAVQSALVRSGSYAYRARPIYSNTFIAFYSRSAGGAARQIFRSSRFYLYVAELPLNGSVSIVKIGGAATFNPEVDLNWDGTLTLADSWYPVIARSLKALAPDGLWHRVEFDVGYGLRVYVDGVLWAGGGTTSYPAGTAISFGAGESPTFVNATADLYFDDILVDGDSFSVTGFPGDGRAVLLKPVGDPAVLNSWTGGAGSNTTLWMPLSQAPPAGLPAASETNTSQIKNAGHGGNLDFKPQVQSYADAGIPSNAAVNAVMAICSDGQEKNKSVKSGGVWIESNPSQPAGGYSFDYGDGYAVVGAFPSGWTSHAGPVTSNPVLNLAAPPTVAIRKTSSKSDVVDVDFLGVYVDYR